ncbi:MAG: SDR family oxidoreductase [Polyangiales bacterium]
MSGPLLVLGASGLVGGELTRVARARGVATIGVARTVLGEATIACDATDPRALEVLVREHEPSAVVVCAAYSHVDGCEANPETSERNNVGIVRSLVSVLANTTTPIVFYSTDQVFDGSREAHVETDPPHPLNVYSRHKLAAEELLLRRGHAIVARVAWVFGEEIRKKNFVYRVAAAARTGERLALPRDQAGCPTSAGWLAESTLELLGQGFTGVAHLTGREAFTKAEWARAIASALSLPAPQVEEVDWRDAGQIAPRPARVVLGTVRHALRQAPADTILRQLHI